MTTQRRVYKNESEAAIARRSSNRKKFVPFSASKLPWRLVVDGKIVACFFSEEDARGFSKARYGEEGYVEARTKATPYRKRSKNEQRTRN